MRAQRKPRPEHLRVPNGFRITPEAWEQAMEELLCQVRAVEEEHHATVGAFVLTVLFTGQPKDGQVQGFWDFFSRRSPGLKADPLALVEDAARELLVRVEHYREHHGGDPAAPCGCPSR